MAIWSKPPREDFDLLNEYVQQTYAGQPCSISCDSQKKLIHLELPSLSEQELTTLIDYLMSKFPGAF